jgi:nucleoside-diphosphate-sugar epimerase
MNVLITGACGFIGGHLVESQLEQGHTVRAADLVLDSFEEWEDRPGLDLQEADVTNKEHVKALVEDIDIVYHLASAHLDVRLSDDLYRQVNVGGTMLLVEAARKASVQRFVHCSSVGVIGAIDEPPADETTICRPTNIYEVTKLEGELAIIEFAGRYEYPVAVARPAWVYGPRDPRTEKMMRAISKGRFPVFGNGRNMRHPVYIRDLIHGLELLAGLPEPGGQVYILAGESPVEVRELVRVLSDELGVDYPKIKLPLAVGQLAGIVLETGFKLIGQSPPFSRRSMDFYVKNNAYDISKARSELGFHPQTDFRSGIRQTIAWRESKILESRDL